MADKLFIGLDVGSDSVGWAATDENFRLYRLKGKTAWGARIFSEANDAKGRRGFRVAGRRLARRKERIRLLNVLFDPLLKEKDPTFLLRLENSAIQNYDPNKPTQAVTDCPLFVNKQEEKEYYKKYPTIWHLRKALMENEDHAFSDIRFLYLAIHHIIKYRGNFLREGDIKIGQFDYSIFNRLNETLAVLFDSQNEDDENEESCFIGLPKSQYEGFITCANDRNLPKQPKKTKLLSMFEKTEESKAFLEMFCTLCAGGEFSTKKLNTKGEETYQETKISFNSSYDENEGTYQEILGDFFDLVDIAKAVFDYCDLSDILNGKNDLSSAFVELYESHKSQLSALKSICKKIDSQNGFVGENSIYVKLFNDPNDKSNYPAFTHNKTLVDKRCDIHTFDKYVMDAILPYESLLAGKDAVNWQMLKSLAEQDRLLQTIALRSTSVIPMQLHQKELKLILKNAISRNIKGIAEIEDKILKLFQYKIPYYCGPLTTKSNYSNVVFKNNEYRPLKPWDYEEAIDWDETKKKFMEGLTNKCTYLKDQNVLPKQSILYQDFDTWNKLNNLKVNGNKPSLEDLNDLFSFVSQRSKTTMRDIQRYLKSKTNSKENDVVVSGWNPEDYICCSSRASFAKNGVFDLIHPDINNPKDLNKCERIIFLKTIYTDSPKDADAAIFKEFPDLTNEQKALLKTIKCKEWSPLSKKFLELRYSDKYGEIRQSIIDLLRNGEGNLMQILAKYDYQEVIDACNAASFQTKSKSQIVSDLIEEMPPKMRRPVIQAVRIVQEVAKVARKEPDQISIEVTRENNDKEKKQELTKKAKSRSTQIQNFLKNLIKIDVSEKKQADEVLEELKKYSDQSINGKHLYLYFLQNGKDAYTGKPINIDNVLSGNKYDTDHIIPQSKMKDDSIDNLVLVEREINQHRSNEYPLPESIRKNPANVAFWRKLKKAGMMSEKKFNNLTRTNPLTEEELGAFVAAQINVVNRSNVVIRDVLKVLYPNAKLIFSKAQYPSQIRKELNIPKLRDLNDTHHAVDAYLNIVSGVSLTDRYGNMRFIKASQDEEKHSLNMERYISSLIQTKEGQKTELGELIDQTSRRHDFLLTYRFSYQDSAFYKQTMYKKNADLIPVHDNLPPERYGGYDSMRTEVNCVATIIGKKTTRYLVGVPHLLIKKAKDGIDVSDELIKLIPHKENEVVKVDLNATLQLDCTVKKEGFTYLCISKNAACVKLKPFSPIFLSRESEIYLSNLIKFVEKYPNIANKEMDFELKTNRTGENTIIFSRKIFKHVLEELVTLSNQPRFDYCPMISKLRDFVFNEQNQETTLGEQLEIIRSFIGVFTRKSETLSNKVAFFKSRGAILQEGLLLCSDSITGLYHTERKL